VERAILDAEKVAGRSFYFGFGTAPARSPEGRADF
jgi:hypothetical protein